MVLDRDPKESSGALLLFLLAFLLLTLFLVLFFSGPFHSVCLVYLPGGPVIVHYIFAPIKDAVYGFLSSLFAILSFAMVFGSFLSILIALWFLI